MKSTCLQLLVTLVAVAGISGCGGARLSLGPWHQADPAVMWIFECPWQIGWGMFGAEGMWGHADNTVVCDSGELVVLTNYGTSWGLLQPCNAFLLDSRTGKVLSRVKGPIQTLGDWYLDGHTVYAEGGEGWRALDLDEGRMSEGEQWPTGKRHINPDWSKFVMAETVADPADGVERSYYDLGGGRVLVLEGSSLELSALLSDGTIHRRSLCRLSSLGPWGIDVIANDDRRLLVSVGRYLIAVDARSLPPLQDLGARPIVAMRYEGFAGGAASSGHKVVMTTSAEPTIAAMRVAFNASRWSRYANSDPGEEVGRLTVTYRHGTYKVYTLHRGGVFYHNSPQTRRRLVTSLTDLLSLDGWQTTPASE